jgi:ubiquinone/menaquinone biosynthesis C-methylase UbiE
MPEAPNESQAQIAQRMYNARADKYNDSWHPEFAQWIVSYLSPAPGSDILDLACGTGLVTISAAKAVGPQGSVVGVDVTEGMLEVLKTAVSNLQKSEEGAGLASISVFHGDITKVEEIEQLKGRKFDAITCASALVLLDDPVNAIKSWHTFLKPGGVLVTDVTHERLYYSGLALERVASRLGIQAPQHRLWIENEDSFRGLLESAGFKVEEIQFHLQHEPKKHSVEAGEEVWAVEIQGEHARALREHDELEAKRMFLQEWKLSADNDGQLVGSGGVYVCKARKMDDSPPPKAVLAGSCACGSVRWTSTTAPEAVFNCCCEPCRKTSGGAYLPLLGFPRWSVSFSPRLSELASVGLTSNARRTFCAKCGSTLTFQHYRSLDRIEVALGSVDEQSLDRPLKEILSGAETSWDWVRSKSSWFDIPDDGVTRNDTMVSGWTSMIYD